MKSTKKIHPFPSTLQTRVLCSVSIFSSDYVSDFPDPFNANTRKQLSICNISFSSSDMLYALLHLNTNKCTGRGGIPQAVIVECAQTLAKPLCKIFNK